MNADPVYDRDAQPGRPAQDARVLPPAPSRQDALGQLRTERWHAAQASETTRVAQIDDQIKRLSAQSSPTSPQRETTSAATPRTERRTTRRKTDHVTG